MKKLLVGCAAISMLFGCKTQNVVQPEQPIVAKINLVDVQDDKVWVTVDPDKFTTENTTFYIPKTVPGTYSTDNYGRFSEGFKALDYKGKELPFVKVDENTWTIADAGKLDKVMYMVNDTFDWEGEGDVYSMAGTNITAGKNFLLNLHGFIGYFQDMTEKKYRLEIQRPSDLIPGTSLTVSQTMNDETSTSKTDIYDLERYFEVTDNPIMYAAPDTTSFMVQDMEVLIDVYSPTGKFSAEGLKPSMEKMIRAQKKFLGDINSTDKYAILVYLSATPGQNDAGNFGALEHHTSTVVVMPETMDQAAMEKSMTDIVSHEFFHIITPLSVHSNEIHYFDYNDPKMSKHLWMYEGVTEYFANLFQVNQGLIDNQEFYSRMVEKINIAKRFDDTVPFTLMSENILTDEYKDSYYNVYQKGALIGMALDIRLRELSGGKTGILSLMKKLSSKYGKDKPFEDDQLISDIVALSYPEIQDFFDMYVTGTTPIPYYEFFEKAGLEEAQVMSEVGYFLKGQTPYITGNQETNQIVFREDIEFNTFLTELGVEKGDILKSVNDTEYTIQNVMPLIQSSMGWKEGEDIKMTVIRNGEEKVLEGKTITPMDKDLKVIEMQNADGDQMEIRNSWLRG